MNETGSDANTEVRHILVPVAVRNNEIVGATLRPDRSLTVGRQRYDRFLAYALGICLLVMSFVAAFTAWRLYFVAQDVRTILERLGP
jgi:uncharacterized membrane protein